MLFFFFSWQKNWIKITNLPRKSKDVANDLKQEINSHEARNSLRLPNFNDK
jgi:hypothetical protein